MLSALLLIFRFNMHNVASYVHLLYRKHLQRNSFVCMHNMDMLQKSKINSGSYMYVVAIKVTNSNSKEFSAMNGMEF